MNSKPYTLDRVVRLIITLSILLGLFFLVKSLSDVLLPFIIGWLLAYFLNPVVLFFQKELKLKSRILSIVSTLLLFAMIITGLLWILIPLVTAEVQKMTELVVTYSKDIRLDSLLPVSIRKEIRAFFAESDFQSLIQNETIMDGLKKIVPGLWNIVNGSLNFILGLAVIMVILLYLIFILKDFDNISTGWLKFVPQQHREIVAEVTNDVKDAMNRYFRGQALIALIVSILFSIAFSIIQLPLAIVLGLLLGLMNMIPYLQTLGLIPAVVLALLRSAETGIGVGTLLIEVGAIFLIIQVIEDVLLTPKIMGNVTGLNPAIILLSLSVWGSLLGFVGLIIALPMTTLLISYYKRYVIHPNTDVFHAPKELL